MKPEVLRKDVDWEAKRVAAAFGVQTFEQVPYRDPQALSVNGGVARWIDPPKTGRPQVAFCAIKGQLSFIWRLDESGKLRYLWLGNKDHTQSVRLFCDDLDDDVWHAHPHIDCNEVMVRGLYRLGIKLEVLVQFNCHLTAHERLELRLTMPREFWPKIWQDA